MSNRAPSLSTLGGGKRCAELVEVIRCRLVGTLVDKETGLVVDTLNDGASRL